MVLVKCTNCGKYTSGDLNFCSLCGSKHSAESKGPLDKEKIMSHNKAVMDRVLEKREETKNDNEMRVYIKEQLFEELYTASLNGDVCWDLKDLSYYRSEKEYTTMFKNIRCIMIIKFSPDDKTKMTTATFREGRFNTIQRGKQIDTLARMIFEGSIKEFWDAAYERRLYKKTIIENKKREREEEKRRIIKEKEEEQKKREYEEKINRLVAEDLAIRARRGDSSDDDHWTIYDHLGYSKDNPENRRRFGRKTR